MEYVERVLLDMIKGFVELPEDVSLFFKESVDDQGDLIVINVKLARQDVGLCIGQKGSTAEAIRRVIGLIGFKQLGKRVYVKIDAPRVPKRHFDYE